MAQGIENFTVRVDPLLSAPDREVLAFLIIDRVLQRTAAGQDIQGNRFARYNPNYREQRQEIGLPTSPNLYRTGQMLNSIQLLRHTRGSITIGVIRGSAAAQKARWQQNGTSDIPSRNFMGIDDVEASGIENEVLTSSPVVQAQRFLSQADIIGKIAEQVTFQPAAILEAAEDALQQRVIAEALLKSTTAAAAAASSLDVFGNVASQIGENILTGADGG